MFIIDSAAALADAFARPLPPAVLRLLQLRRDQLGGNIEDAARFIVVEPPDRLADVEAAIGFPLVLDGAPAWEWLKRHDSNILEIVFVFGDTADVLLLSSRDSLDPALTAILQQHAALDGDRQQALAP